MEENPNADLQALSEKLRQFRIQADQERQKTGQMTLTEMNRIRNTIGNEIFKGNARFTTHTDGTGTLTIPNEKGENKDYRIEDLDSVALLTGIQAEFDNR